MKIGIITETKNPPDRRVPLNPEQCRRLLDENPGLEIVVQHSPQLGDACIDGARPGGVIPAPDGIQEPLPCQQFVGMLADNFL